MDSCLSEQVTWKQEEEGNATDSRVLRLLELDEATGASTWGLADVKANRRKGVAKLSKRELGIRFEVPLSSIQNARLHLDM